MQIVFDVADESTGFALEVLRNLAFVINPRPVGEGLVADDTLAYLLSSPANAERLRLAYEQYDRGEVIPFTPPAE